MLYNILGESVCMSVCLSVCLYVCMSAGPDRGGAKGAIWPPLELSLERLKKIIPEKKKKRKKKEKQAQRRAATETDVHIIIDILLHTVDAFIADANIQTFF